MSPVVLPSSFGVARVGHGRFGLRLLLRLAALVEAGIVLNGRLAYRLGSLVVGAEAMHGVADRLRSSGSGAAVPDVPPDPDGFDRLVA